MIFSTVLFFFVESPAEASRRQDKSFVRANKESGLIDFYFGNQLQMTQGSAEVRTDKGIIAVSDGRFERKIAARREKNSLWPTVDWTILEATDRNRQLDIRWYFKSDGQGRWLVQMDFTNVSQDPLIIYSIVPLKALCMGSWSGGSILHYSHLNRGRSMLVSQNIYPSTNIIATNRPAAVVGFLTTTDYINSLSMKPLADGMEITAIQQADGILLPPGQSRRTEVLWISRRPDVNKELELWADTAAAINKVNLLFNNFATWCSWYTGCTFAKNLNGQLEKLAQANIPIIADKFLPLGLECMRVVDDSLKRGTGDWPLVTDALPSGYTALANQMQERGIRAGFWCDVHRVGVEAEAFTLHPEWLARDGDRPLLYDDPAYGKYAVLDATVPGARQRLEELTRRFRNAGYRYCFTDFISQVALSPKNSHNLQSTACQTARLAFESIRKGFGSDFYFLSQNAPFASWGLITAMRVSHDSFGNRVSTYRDATAFWFLNQRLFFVDPDAWCPLRHEYLWDRCWGSWQLLGGFPITIGADFTTLTPERETMIKKLLPPLNQTGRPRDIWERRYPVVLEQTFAISDESWKVVGLFNFKPYAVHATINLDRLWNESIYPTAGFEADAELLGRTSQSYLIYDFWDEAFLGVFDGDATIRLDPLKGHRVLVIRPQQDHPQVLSVGDHIGQGIEEIKNIHWNNRTHTLSGKTKGRRGVVDTVVRLYVPDGWALQHVKTDKMILDAESLMPNVYKFTVPDRYKEILWTAQFIPPKPKNTKKFLRPVNPLQIVQIKADSESVAAFKSELPEMFKKTLGTRLNQFDSQQSTLMAYIKPEISTAEEYTGDVGFGFLRGVVIPFWHIHRYLLSPYGFFDEKAIVYRMDDLSPEQQYQIGIVPFSTRSEPNSVRLLIRRVTDQQEFILDAAITCPYPTAEKQVKEILWYAIPTEAIDSKGIQIEIQNTSGYGVSLSEIWLLLKKAKD